MNKPQPDRQQEYREEAERLALLDKQTQRDYVAMYRAKGKNRKVSKADRADALAQADALERLLGLAKRRSV